MQTASPTVPSPARGEGKRVQTVSRRHGLYVSAPDTCALSSWKPASVSPVAASMTSHPTPTRNKPSTGLAQSHLRHVSLSREVGFPALRKLTYREPVRTPLTERSRLIYCRRRVSQKARNSLHYYKLQGYKGSRRAALSTPPGRTRVNKPFLTGGNPTMTIRVTYVLMVLGVAAFLAGCSSSDDNGSADLQRQLDMRADISPEDLAALRAQVEELTGRADISPEALAAVEEELEEFRTARMQRQQQEQARPRRDGGPPGWRAAWREARKPPHTPRAKRTR